jgi:hypothetical protein|tara:strand:+ start:2840 stop:4519 length:1680 start_codon:yes stop_codon:yes gene_type:complete
MPKIKITNNLDNLSFNKAFSQSRKSLGSGNAFKWRGQRYTTNYKEEEDRSKSVQDEIVKASNEKTVIESPNQRKKVNTAFDLQDQIVNTNTADVTDPLAGSQGKDISQFIKTVKDKNSETSWMRGEEGFIPDEVEGYFKKGVGIGQNLLKKAGELIDFDNDLIENAVNTGKRKYNESKEILADVADDLKEVANDGVEAQKIRVRNIKNKVSALTNNVKDASESELHRFKDNLNDSFLHKTLLPFIQKNVPWGDVDETTKKIIENPQTTTETLTDSEKTNLFTMFNEKVLPKVTQMSDNVKDYVGDIKQNIEDKIPNSKREFLNDDLYPFIRDKMFGGLPRPIRQMLVQRANISGETMTDDEKLGLYMAYKNAISRGDDMVKYKDYGSDRDLWKQFQGGEESIMDAGRSYFDASDQDKGAYNMMMTIGGEHFREEDGNIIFDQGYYDFNEKEGPYDPNKELSQYGKLRNYMSQNGVSEDDPNRAKIDISLNKQEMEDQMRQLEEAKAAQATAANPNAPFIYQNIPQNIIPLLVKGSNLISSNKHRFRTGGVRTKYPKINK